MKVAIVRPPARSFTRAINSWYARSHSGEELAIDYDRALWQHQQFTTLLERLGIRVFLLDPNERFPDGCFVQDPMLVAGRNGLSLTVKEPSRRDEGQAIIEMLRSWGSVLRNAEGGTCDGGDVIVAKDLKRVWVGRSERTDEDGYWAVKGFYEQMGYSIESVPVTNCLHLGTGMSYLGRNILLVSDWLDVESQAILSGSGENEAGSVGVRTKHRTLVRVPVEESPAANVLVIGRTIVMAEGYPSTRRLLQQLGFSVITTPINEFEKADGSISCLALLFDL